MAQRERTNTRGVGILELLDDTGITLRTEVRSMDQLIPSLAMLVGPFRDCFHPQVFQTFQVMLAGWIVCVGRRTLSEVWQATGLAAKPSATTTPPMPCSTPPPGSGTTWGSSWPP
jgi:hypothetical protein